jgi:glucose-1-phosphate adenylyltransferase
VRIGAGSVINVRSSIPGAAVPPGTHIGVNPEEDARRFYMSEAGVALVTRDMARQLIKKG